VKKVFQRYSDGKKILGEAYLWAWNPFLRRGASSQAASLARSPRFWCPNRNV